MTDRSRSPFGPSASPAVPIQSAPVVAHPGWCHCTGCQGPYPSTWSTRSHAAGSSCSLALRSVGTTHRRASQRCRAQAPPASSEEEVASPVPSARSWSHPCHSARLCRSSWPPVAPVRSAFPQAVVPRVQASLAAPWIACSPSSESPPRRTCSWSSLGHRRRNRARTSPRSQQPLA